MSTIIDSLEPALLVGGITQQDVSISPETHVSGMVNYIPDVRCGSRRRPGTVFDRKFTMAPNADVVNEFWRWSATENYIVVLGRGGGAPILRIFRDGGDECSVTIASDATTYLNTNSPGSADLVFCPLPDFAMVINSTVATADEATPSFTVARHRPTYRDMIAVTTSVGDYIQTDEDDGVADKGYYQYTPGAYTPAHINFATMTSYWTIHDGFWNDANYFPCGFSVMFRRAALTGFVAGAWDATARTITLSGGEAGRFTHTHRAGDMIELTAGTGHTPGWYAVESRPSTSVLKLFANAGLAGANNTDTAANSTSVTYAETNIARIATRAEANVDFSQVSVGSMHDVAFELQKSLRSSGASGACVAWVPQAGGGNFQLTSPFVGNNAIVYAPTAPTLPVGSSGDLTVAGRPFDPATIQIIGGTGGAAPSGSDTNEPESRWTRVGAPGQPAGRPDATTMPIQILRLSANTFTVDLAGWTSRTAGDSSDNPGPKLITNGETIKDVVWHENRLFMIGGSYIEGSNTKDPFDFYMENPEQPVETDPISKTVPGRHRGDGQYLVSWNDVLVVFHEAGQFELSSGEQPLTPTSATLNPSTGYPGTRVRPRGGTSQLFFASASDTGLQILEYAYNDLRAMSDASIVTSHVPTLIPENPRGIALVPISQTMIVLPSEGQTLYVYRWHYSGTEKLQSAWTMFEFDSVYRIAGVAAGDADFWMLVENTATYTVGTGALTLTIASHGYSDGDPITFSDSTTTPSVDGTKYVDSTGANTVAIYDDVGLTTPTNLSSGGTLRWHTGDYTLERLSVSATRTPPGWAYQPHMDRQLTLTGVHAAGVTTFTLPSSPAVVSGSAQFNGLGSTLNYAVLGPAFGSDSGDVVQIASYSSTAITLTGDYSDGEVTFGRFFNGEIELPRPFARNGRGRPNIRQPMTVLGVAVRHQSTCAYSLQLEQAGMTTRTRTHDSDVSPQSGTLKTLLGGDVDKSTWKIVDVSTEKAVRPATIVSVQYDVERSPDADNKVN